MAYVTREARVELLETIAEAVAEMATAIGALGAAYEALDEQLADRIEDELFRPLQSAYGKAKRTHLEFAARHALPTRSFPSPAWDGTPLGGRELLDRGLEAIEEADLVLVALQDSGSAIEVGDRELRGGLAEVRGLLAPLPGRGNEIERVLGR